MKTNLILCLILIASLYACTEKTSKEVYTSFERTDTLAANVHTIPPIMLNPKGIFLTGPYLVALNDKMDTCFQVFDKTTLQYLYSFGLKGQGPNDFQMPSGQFAGHHSGTTLVTDVNRVKAISFVDGKPQITPVLLPIQRSYYNGLISMAD